MTIRHQLQQAVVKRVRERWPELADPPAVVIEPPRDSRHGDYATNVALQLAPALKRPPLDIAQEIADGLMKPSLGTVEVAAPGFVNIRLASDTLKRVPAAILREGKQYGTGDAGKGARVHVEFISANPTGPLHLGNGRGAFLGDVTSNLLSAAGYKVWREYYVNDIGKQVETLAESVVRKYFIRQGIVMEYPDHLYQGGYVEELAVKLKLDGAKADMRKLRRRVQSRVLNLMLADIKKLVEKRLGVRYDRWFRESELYAQKLDAHILAKLRHDGLVEVRDGAVWMKTTQFGDDKDRVLVKANGEQTYFLSDVAYVNDKFNRRTFDRAIIFLGADHHGYVGRLKAAAAALGHPGALQAIIMQLVRLIRDGQEVRMSKRAGNFVTLDELVDWVGPDVARFFFLMHAADTHMDFDLNLAKERSEKNPVFYVQYAHARICSVVRKVEGLLHEKKGVGRRAQGAGKVKMVRGMFGEPEAKLARVLLRYPDVVEDAAAALAPQQLPFFALDLARAFHDYYDRARIIEGETVNQTRLTLLEATRQVLQNCLSLMGVSAPEKM
ncbi:MAG: arginine--tRNA ligase [Candidatus Kerfeldbacteria bacterium]|nr:arginine--tRNA ligase [Candidatus Kerfeldbacteria bacterium]